MTHTLHRQGTKENLANDFPMHYKFARGFNSDPYPIEQLRRFFDIVHKKKLANSGDIKLGNQFVQDLETLRGAMYTPHAVATDAETVTEIIREVKEADIGLSLTVSGLEDVLYECCKRAGNKPYAVEHSLGILGNRDELPPQMLLEVTTMCGHAMVASGAVEDVIRKIKRGEMTCEEGGKELAKPCQCGVFNPVRAAALLEEACALYAVVQR